MTSEVRGLLATAVLAAACGDGDGPSAVSTPMPTPFPGTVACNVTLAEFCGGRCPTYAERVEQMRRTCAGLSPYIRRWAGHCPGVYYYVHEDNLVIGGFAEQFDGSGVMIGGHRYSDTTSFCNRTAFSVEAGVRLTCPVALDLEELCTRR